MPFRIAGEYLDENGDPIAGATVIANVRSDGSVAGTATTDALGQWEIDPVPSEGEMLYVSVFQDGFVPQIFDQIDPEFYVAPVTGFSDLLLIGYPENQNDFAEAFNYEARLFSRGAYSADEGETWTVDSEAIQYGELVGSPILITGGWGVGVSTVDLSAITVPAGLDSRNLIVVGMMLHDQGNRYNTSIFIGTNNFAENDNNPIPVSTTMLIANPAPSPSPRALMRTHEGQIDVPEDGAVRVTRAGTLDGAVNFRIWIQFVNYVRSSSENGLGEPSTNYSLPSNLTPNITVESFSSVHGGINFYAIGRENQDDDLGSETLVTNSSTPFVELVAPDTWESGFFPGWGARMFVATGQQADEAEVPEAIELDWVAANAAENGGLWMSRYPAISLDATRCVAYVARHGAFIQGRDGMNGYPARRSTNGQAWTQVAGLPEFTAVGQTIGYSAVLDVPEWSRTFISSGTGATPEGDLFYSTDLTAWSNPTTINGAGTTVSRCMAYVDDTLVSLDGFNINSWIYSLDQGATFDTVDSIGYGPEDPGENGVALFVAHLPGEGFAFMLTAERHFIFSADGSAGEFRRIANIAINFVCSDCKYIPYLGVLLAVGFDGDTGESIVAYTDSLTADAWTVLTDTLPTDLDLGFESFTIAVAADSVVVAGSFGTVNKSDDLVTWVEKTVTPKLPWSGIAAGTFS